VKYNMGVHAIIVIKNERNEYLQYFDNRWNSFLFLNCKLLDGENADIVKDTIVDKLNVKKELIKVSLIGNKKHEKFSESDKIQKEYVHYFYKVDLNEKLNNEEFEINGIQYKWFSYANLLKDKRIQQVNSDIVQFVKEFDI